MKAQLTSLRLFLWVPLAVVSLMAPPAFADDDLVGNSPFVPEGWKPPRKPEPPPTRQNPQQQDRPLDRVEFRGLTTFGGEQSFSIHDPSSDRSFWLREGQGEAGFRIIEYRDDEEAVVVEHDGDTRTIPLHEAKIAAVEQPREAPRPSPGGRGNTSRTRRQVDQNQDPEERMQNLAEEIRRRREMRRQILERSQDDQGGEQQDGAPPVPSP